MACLRLGVKGLGFAPCQIIVWDGKDMEDQLTMLPEA
jgi:hypothetical protein